MPACLPSHNTLSSIIFNHDHPRLERYFVSCEVVYKLPGSLVIVVAAREVLEGATAELVIVAAGKVVCGTTKIEHVNPSQATARFPFISCKSLAHSLLPDE